MKKSEILDQFIGMWITDAKPKIENLGYQYRIIGEHHLITADYKPDRLNIKVNDGKIERWYFG